MLGCAEPQDRSRRVFQLPSHERRVRGALLAGGKWIRTLGPAQNTLRLGICQRDHPFRDRGAPIQAVYAKRRSALRVAVPEPFVFGTIVKRRWLTWWRLKRCSSR